MLFLLHICMSDVLYVQQREKNATINTHTTTFTALSDKMNSTDST